MTTYSYADIEDWVSKVDAVMDAVISQATADSIAAVKIVPGISREGQPLRGQIPRDLGALAGSLQSTLYGSTSMTGTGEESYALVAGEMRAGDAAVFGWGGEAAPYAARIHYGFNGTDELGRTYNTTGLFWIDDMAVRWPAIVKEAVAKVKAELA
jgi:hypothetical protein